MDESCLSRRGARCAPVLLSLCILGADSAAWAQVAPAWNRRVTGISLEENPAGGYDIIAEWRIDLEGMSSTDVEVGTSVDLEINGTAQSTIDNPQSLTWDQSGGDVADCAGQPDGQACGTAIIDGTTTVNLTCDADTGTCSTPSFDVNFPGVSLAVADEIIVLLRPAPGALPDSSANDDDDGLLTFGSWNRRLVSVDVKRVPGETSLFDVFAEIVLEMDATSTVPLQLGIDTEPQAGDPCCEEACCCPSCAKACGGNGCGGPGSFFDISLFAPPARSSVLEAMGATVPFVCTAGTCTEPCAAGETETGGTFTATCDSADCACHSETLTLTWTGLNFESVDEIMVILRPAPGALPELPGFQDDDFLVAPVPSPLPAVSEWGMLVLVLALLALATVVIRLRATPRQSIR